MRDESTSNRVAFLAGALTALAVAAIPLGFVGWRVGLRELARQVVPAGRVSDERLAPLPLGLVAELQGLGAVFDNAENLTGARDHDNLLVRPDERRIYVLRPKASVDAYLLATPQPLNLDPPVLYLRAGSPISAALRDYLERNTRLRYSFDVDARGFRRTLPPVEARRKVLMVGDSVLFGVGIDDQATMASALQALVGDSLQIVNAGVGEYGTEEIYRSADVLSSETAYQALVYVACQNDFDDGSRDAYLESASRMLERLSELAPRFGGRIVVLLATAMEYTTYDILQGAGWPSQQNALVDHLRAELPLVARRLGIGYVDWAEVVARAPQQEGSLFHRFAFYVDRVHLSPLGNRLAARELHRALLQAGVGER